MAWLLDKEIRRELPEEWKGIVPTEIFLKEAPNIVQQADSKGITLRILGGLGIAVHCIELKEFAQKLGRIGTGAVQGQEYSDLDFMSYSKQRQKVKDLFDGLGYAKRRATLSSAASERQIYYHPKGWFYVDVFFDKLLVANHPVNFMQRLELDYPTTSVTDLLLEKIQMWEAFSAKDLKDCLLLLKSHNVREKADKDKDVIDASYIASLLAEDWGFWYTATTNLKKIHRLILEIDRFGKDAGIDPSRMQKEELEEVALRTSKLLEIIEQKPKSFKWKMRSRIGTSQRWYNPVERPETVGGFGIWEALTQK
jgi:hypothetical protein